MGIAPARKPPPNGTGVFCGLGKTPSISGLAC